MAQIEHRVETAGEQPDYSGREFTPEEIAAGVHREFIGGVWDTHGERQLEYLRAQGLPAEPEPVYTVRFAAGELFGAGDHSVTVDVWESRLEDA